MTRLLIAGSLLLASIYAAHAISFGREGISFGKLGAMPGAASSSPAPPGCSGTGLDFTVPCNSQYISLL